MVVSEMSSQDNIDITSLKYYFFNPSDINTDLSSKLYTNVCYFLLRDIFPPHSGKERPADLSIEVFNRSLKVSDHIILT